jgi:uncharacterized membrane protein (DUF106 family)
MLTQLVIWLNRVAGDIANVVLAPIAWLPGWLSATLIAVVTGVVMLLVFKHTSNQEAIKQTRNSIKANLLALSLFKDNLRVGLRAQGSLLAGAARLLALSIVPMLVMLVPMCLLLGQLALWYQARPLQVGEETVVTVHLAEDAADAVSGVQLVASPAITTTVGPVRVPAKNMVCWNLRADEAGCRELLFEVDGRSFRKELAVGNGFMPTSLKRPEWSLSEILLHPREEPLSRDMPVQSIEVDFPTRSSWTSGSDAWLLYWFIVSMVAAFAARPLIKVNV